MFAIVGLICVMTLAGCSATSSSPFRGRPSPASVSCRTAPAGDLVFQGVRGCTGSLQVSCPQVDLVSAPPVTVRLLLDGTQLIGTAQVPSGGKGVLSYQIPFSIPPGDTGRHTLVQTCGGSPNAGSVTYPFILITERLTVTPTSTKIGDKVTVSATGVDCEDDPAVGSERHGDVLIEWADAPGGTDVLLARVRAPAGFDPVPSLTVTVPPNADQASTVSLRCDFDPPRAQRATANVKVASPYTLVLNPPTQTVGGLETVTVKGLSCAGSTPATAVVLDEGVTVAEFPATDTGEHKGSFKVDKPGIHHIGVRCTWQKSVRSDLTGTLTVSPPPVLQALKPSSGPVGIGFMYTISGVTCPAGTPLQLVWDGTLVLDSLADATNITKVYAFSQDTHRVPQTADGNHTVGVRCGENGQPLGDLQAFAVTSQPNLSVDPPRGLPGDAIFATQTGFNCINPTPGYNNKVIFLLDNVRLTDLTVPAGIPSGKHTLVARCDWPQVDPGHQRSRTFWVPSISLTPTQGHLGDPITVALAGFDCPTATVYFGGSPTADVTISADGIGSATVTPTDLVEGTFPVGANCPNSTVRPTANYVLAAVLGGATGGPTPQALTPEPEPAGPFWAELFGAILALLLVVAVGTYLVRRGRGPRGPRGRPPGLRIELELGLPRLQVRERP